MNLLRLSAPTPETCSRQFPNNRKMADQVGRMGGGLAYLA
jgi:hypothetical protein